MTPDFDAMGWGCHVQSIASIRRVELSVKRDSGPIRVDMRPKITDENDRLPTYSI